MADWSAALDKFLRDNELPVLAGPSTCGGARAGAKVAGVHGSPSAARTARATAESTTTAITLRRPPHGYESTSVTNTRRDSSAHGTRPSRAKPARRRHGGPWLAGACGHQLAELCAPLAGRAEHARVANQMVPGGEMLDAIPPEA